MSWVKATVCPGRTSRIRPSALSSAIESGIDVGDGDTPAHGQGAAPGQCEQSALTVAGTVGRCIIAAAGPPGVDQVDLRADRLAVCEA